MLSAFENILKHCFMFL